MKIERQRDREQGRRNKKIGRDLGLISVGFEKNKAIEMVKRL